MLLLASYTPLPAQQEPYPFNFTQISKDNGLPHNYCHTALRDRRGFLWFGTQDGLARYDGVRFNVYPYRDDTTGLSAPTVLDLDEDARGFLWIATVGGGLNCFNPKTGAFTWYQNDPRDPNTLPGNNLTNLLIDTDGSIWVGGLSSGLSRMDPASGHFQNYALAQNLTTADDQLRRNSVLDIASDSEDPQVLWLAVNDGVFRFYKNSGRLEHFPTQTPCHDVLADTPGIIWVATDGGGIARMDKHSGRWEFFPPLPEAWAQRNLSKNLIADISRKSDREFWVAALDLGFGIFDLETKKYRFFNTQSKLLAGQTNQSANGLYRDPSGLLWIFNHKNGISLLGPASNIFDYTALPAAGCLNALVNEPQDFVWNSKRQELYVVTTGCQGLYVFEPVERTAPVQLSGQSPYRLKYVVKPPGANGADFYRVLIDRHGRVWVGGQPTRSGYSLYHYLPEQRRLEPFRHPDAADLQRFPVNDLAEDQAGNIWVATTRGGFFRIDVQKHKIDHFLRSGPFNGARTQIVDLVCRHVPGADTLLNEQIWFSTKEAGVFCFYPGINQFVRYGHQPGAETGLVEDYVTALEQGVDNCLWVGTASKGLQQIPADASVSSRFPHYSVKDGLAFNSIHRLALAPDGQLWIATEKGISVFDPESRRFKIYDESDGLADTYLRNKGFRWCTSGEIFVGQAKGFYSFHPNAIYHNQTPPVLAFTGFDLFGKPWPTGIDLNVKPEVRLKHDQNFFTIHFAALSFSQSNRNQYFYQLDDIDPDWIASGNRAEVSYTQVPPGKYTFRVRAHNNSGVDSAGELVLHIVVEPAFYQTWWFRSLLAAALLAVVAWYVSRLLKQQEAKNEINRLRALKAELENKVLRSQMNPHFMFNTLNTIEALIVEEKPEAASALLQKFSKLVRLVLENSQHANVTLALELEALDLYLQLEAVRLDHRFDYRIEVDPELERKRCLIPPLILQPFTENAILHGLRHLQERRGLLRICLNVKSTTNDKGNAEHKVLHCAIIDNGIGRARAAEINARSRISKKKQSLGTRITTERVELLNQAGRQAYSVEITDLADEGHYGTRVSIILPLAYPTNEGEH